MKGESIEVTAKVCPHYVPVRIQERGKRRVEGSSVEGRKKGTALGHVRGISDSSETNH